MEKIAVFVDLDGTLVKEDTTVVAILNLLKSHIFYLHLYGPFERS